MRFTPGKLLASIVCVLLGVALVAQAEPHTLKALPWDWETPGCFAWSKSEETYACVEFQAVPGEGEDAKSNVAVGGMFNTDDGGLRVEGSMDQSVDHAKQLDARINLGIRLPAKTAEKGEVRWHRFDDSSPAYNPTLHSMKDLKSWLAEHGFTTAATTSPLPHQNWTEIDGVAYRYAFDIREGDASFKVYGKLEIRCSEEDNPQQVLEDVHIGGPLAVLSRARGTSKRALTTEVHDGGEGYVDVTHHSFLFDEANFCE